MNDFEDIAYEDSVSSDTYDYEPDDLEELGRNESFEDAQAEMNEGGEDSYLDSQYEDANGCGYDGE